MLVAITGVAGSGKNSLTAGSVRGRDGAVSTDLAMVAGVAIACAACGGAPSETSVLECVRGGRHIAEVLVMSVSEAQEFLGAGGARVPAAHAILVRLAEVGLGCRCVGHPLTTQSGVSGNGWSRRPGWARGTGSTSWKHRRAVCT